MNTDWEKRFDEQDFCWTDFDGSRKLHTNRDVTNEVKQFITNELSQSTQKAVEGERERCVQTCHKIAVLAGMQLDRVGIKAIDEIIKEIKSGNAPLTLPTEEKAV